MKATVAYEAKRAFFDELKVLTGHGMEFEEVQVGYSYPGRDRARVCIYGGGVRFMHEDVAGEVNAVGHEVITLGVYIRVLKPGGTVEDAESEAEDVADRINKVFTDKPYIAGSMTWIGVQQGNGDYSETPDGPEAVLSLQVSIGAMMI